MYCWEFNCNDFKFDVICGIVHLGADTFTKLQDAVQIVHITMDRFHAIESMAVKVLPYMLMVGVMMTSISSGSIKIADLRW